MRVGGVVAVVAVYTRPRLGCGDCGRLAKPVAVVAEAESTVTSTSSSSSTSTTTTSSSSSSDGSDSTTTAATPRLPAQPVPAATPVPVPVSMPGLGSTATILRRTPLYLAAVVGREADVDSVWRLVRSTAQVAHNTINTPAITHYVTHSLTHARTHARTPHTHINTLIYAGSQQSRVGAHACRDGRPGSRRQCPC